MTSDPVATPMHVRPIGPDKAEEVLAIVLAGELADLGETGTELDGVSRDLSTPEQHWYGVDDAAGLAGYVWVARFPSHVTADAEVRLRPDADRGLGPMLLQTARDHASTDIAPGRPVQMWTHSTDVERQGWLVDAGGVEVRRFWRMVVHFGDTEPPPPVVPGDVTVVTVGNDEARMRALFEIVETSFADHYGVAAERERTFEEFIDRMHGQPGFDPTLWWLASADDQPAAALIGTRAMPSLGFVNTLGTLRQWRGRGLGRVLLQTALTEMHRRGDRRVGLVVDATNETGAVKLYESVGMRTEHTWTVYELPPLTATR
jgi:mycothiol synthase